MMRIRITQMRKMKMLKSWIIITITLYFISTGLYGFHDNIFDYHELNFWDHYFWISTLLTSIISASWNFKRNKSFAEMAFITFFVFFRLLVLLYYIVGLILDAEHWMGTHVYFWCAFGFSSLIGLFYYFKRNHEAKKDLFA